MHFPHNFSALSPTELAEMHLQEELREMFVVDTQQHLDSYFSLVAHLTSATWITDIQHIYRAIHTIKGGAVTVEADGVLYAGTALEDLLSDLRYLDVAPELNDGQLCGMLQEAGELLASCMEIVATGEQAARLAEPTTQRIQFLHAQIKQQYLPEWNEQKQLHQEFAEQGFDLVVLELEMTVERMVNGQITSEMRHIAQSTINQLTQIGQDIELASDWYSLLNGFQEWLFQANSAAWQQNLRAYLQICKGCVLNSGEMNDDLRSELAHLNTQSDVLAIEQSDQIGWEMADGFAEELDIEGYVLDDLELNDLELGTLDHSDVLDDLWSHEADTIPLLKLNNEEPKDVLNVPFFIETLVEMENADLPEKSAFFPGEQAIADEPKHSPETTELCQEDWDIDTASVLPMATDAWVDTSEFLWEELIDAEQPVEIFDDRTLELIDDILENDDLFVVAATNRENHNAEIRRNLQVPVPLERLDRSAQQVVDTLLSARGVMSISQQLQVQLAKLNDLTDESAQFITYLRQLQNDYALLRHISSEPSSNVSLERYRQGYSTINRLLENILRMSELGREIETSSQRTTISLANLDRNILSLKDRIESSRLVPFRNLTMRARAILRDLTNRYGKPAELVIENENVELDAGVIQQLEPVILHLLRNAYDHGLESSAERSAIGKHPVGTIRITLQRRGNYYNLEISDDGGGINASEISRKAQSQGFSLTNTGTAAALLAVLCQPGLSSRDTVSEVSGRGVGMDVVASQVELMGGKISLQTMLGQGTTFAIEVPAPQLLVSCVLLQVGVRLVAVPTDEIQEMLLLDDQATKMSTGWQIRLADGRLANAWDLNAYWQQPLSNLSETAIAVRSRWSGLDSDTAWLIADDLVGQAELLISPFPHPIVPPMGILGVSVQPNGRLISVFDPNALLVKLRSQAAIPTPVVADKPENNQLILIVDDAALMRRRLESSLNNHGFVTHACSDGLEALSWMHRHGAPSLLITDIEMPNMDGFTLIDNCHQQGFNMPIVVISSRLSEEWSKEAYRLGANHYLNKGFTTPVLIDMVRSMLTLQPV